ncbi:MAG: IPExxxVDY family protein [Bacteroidia bacterium]
MAIHKLLIDDFEDADYSLIAIHSSLEDYRLAYFVNRELEIKLEKCPKDIGVKQKDDLVLFSRYLYDDADRDIAWHLIQNKNSITTTQTSTESLFDAALFAFSTSVFFLPELRTADYVLKIENAPEADEAIVQGLLNVKHITTAYKVDHYKLKSKNNLIF